MPPLTGKQAAFVREYCLDYNATRAAIRAGYSEASAREIGYENLTKPYIKQAIKDHLHTYHVNQERVMGEMARIAFSDIADYIEIEEGGGMVVKATSELAPGLSAAIESYKENEKVIELKDGGLLRDRKAEIKLHNKVYALDKMAKALGLYGTEGGEGNAATTSQNPGTRYTRSFPDTAPAGDHASKPILPVDGRNPGETEREDNDRGGDSV